MLPKSKLSRCHLKTKQGALKFRFDVHAANVLENTTVHIYLFLKKYGESNSCDFDARSGSVLNCDCTIN